MHVLFLIASRTILITAVGRGAAHAPAPPAAQVCSPEPCALPICFQVPTNANNYSLSLVR